MKFRLLSFFVRKSPFRNVQIPSSSSLLVSLSLTGTAEIMSEGPSCRILCRRNSDYCLSIRGGYVVFAINNPCDRYQLWFKDNRHGAAIKDSEGQPAFALVNKATGQAIGHCPNSEPVPLIRYDVDSYDKSVLWTMSKNDYGGFRNIRRVDDITILFAANGHRVHDGHIIDLYCTNNVVSATFQWKIQEVMPSTDLISLFQPSQQTVKIHSRGKIGYNLTIAKDGSTVMLVPSNPKDKYQHWIKETAYGIPVKDEKENVSFAIVNKATGKAIKHGYGSGYLVQLAPFNRNYMDTSLLWTGSNYVGDGGFQEIRVASNISMALHIFDVKMVDCPLVGLLKRESDSDDEWKTEHFEWKIEDFE
ncbi:Ricin B-like lectin R40C1 [Rhynchospora pubera]|uniref:Ricin B-like lectin R40C1 n=1 Tax=Rhynchospora pubera TaxID=906938 RepID=A0AAV8GED7_9POAL|nr:Ricin B-like lectin R40C1 [Rhynchospora pubera]KAJ4745646.1 Ricin B-like lectin R40C1 [Rhynchospora pubera]KAJ4801258.1 Ricin B-like lectin R40C1 [Rhynchospora pubera]